MIKLLLSSGLCFLLGLLAIAVLAFLYAQFYAWRERWINRKESEFETLFNEIQADITHCKVSFYSEAEISHKLKRLADMKWNREKYKFLNMEYLKKFSSAGEEKRSVKKQIQEINETRV